MPKKRLTEEGVAKLNPPVSGKQVDYFDAVMPGLILRVNYGGAKVWRALHYVKRLDADGKRLTMPTTFKLGRYPTLSVKQARDKARQFLADPEKALAQADTGSFKEVAENFLKRHVEANKLRWQDEIERCLNKYIYPVWQHRTFRELKRADVAQLLDLIEDRHGKRQADVVLAIVRKIMRWFASRNDDYIVPVVPGMNRSNPKDRKRSRIIGKHKGKDGYNDDEFRAFWKACGETGKFGALLKVALLTAQRREKVASMQWADLVDGKWRIPSEEREKTNAGNLRLPQLVLDIINAQPRIDGNPHVFPGSTRGRRRLKGKPSGPPAFNSFSQAKAELDAKLPDLPHWTLHDLRRTARSLMSRAGVASDIAERVLGHAIAGVEGVYDQHDYAEEKADALQRLAALVETIINPPEDNVVALGERHRTRKQGGLLVASGGLAQPKRAGDAEAAWRGTNAVPWRVSLTVRKWMALDSTQSGVRWLRGGCPLPRSGLAPTASPNALVGNYPPRQLPPASIWVPTGAHRWALLPPAPFGMANAHRCPPARLARGAGRDSCLRGCGSSTTLPLACR